MYVCTNCEWKGEELTKQSKGAMWDDKCPVCGDEVVSSNSELPIEKEEEVEEFIESEKKLDDMTKDELNDYAAKNLPNLKINYWWSKKKILRKIKGEQ